MLRKVIASMGFSFTVVLGWSGSAHATVPAGLTEQGRLLDGMGNPINTSVTMTFAIYTSASAGTPATAAWTEKQTIPVDNGFFSAVLGEVTPIPTTLFNGAEMWLGLTINTDAEMAPRQPILSVPYAFVANNAIGDITPTSVSITGPTGPVEVINGSGQWVGPSSGLVGPTGPAGAAGSAGAQGAQGVQGAAGPTGPDGAAGAKGAQGVQGVQGPAGVQGPTGPQGSVGAQGGQGPQGVQGVQGPQGPAGPNAAYKNVTFSGASVTGSTFANMASITFTAPSAGNALVLATAYCNVTSGGNYRIQLDTTATGTGYDLNNLWITDMTGSTGTQMGFAVQRSFAASAGSNTYYLNGLAWTPANASISCIGNMSVLFSASLLP